MSYFNLQHLSIKEKCKQQHLNYHAKEITHFCSSLSTGKKMGEWQEIFQIKTETWSDLLHSLDKTAYN